MIARSYVHAPFPLPRSRQRGAVAILVGLTMVVLVGFLGLALDSGRLYVTKTELQNSADACALAAAQALTTANPLSISEAAGMKTGSANKVMFQFEEVAYAVDASVTFSNTLGGTYFTKDMISPANARFVRCTVERTGIPTWFIQVLNLLPGVAIGTGTVRATAVASQVSAQTNCALPVAICSTAVPIGTPAGTWVEGAIGPSGGGGNGAVNLTGNFKWVDFSPSGGGARELSELLTGPGTCNLPASGSQVGQPGNISSASRAWNTRFGIYPNNTSATEAVPDYTGYAYTEVNWPSRFNAYGDFRTRRTSNAIYQGDAATGLNAVNGSISIAGSSVLAANGADRRLAIAPIVDCSGFTSGPTAPVVDWACVLMLHPINTNVGSGGGAATGRTRMYLEYRGRSNELGSPCASLGVPGVGGVSMGPQVPALFQ